MRDSGDTCITICNMENFDPMGIHTGDSIVVTPSQTLSDNEHQMLRSAAINIIRFLGIEGGCNIQFAVKDGKYVVVEVNPRVSRSSALASKATGYPIARVAAKIAIGLNLDEISNDVTGETPASFEPAIDYVVAKIPRWPFDKFVTADNTLTTAMKSTGEVMAIGRTIEEALLKAVRSLDIDMSFGDAGTGTGTAADDWTPDRIRELLRTPTDQRLFAAYYALRTGFSSKEISELTSIDPFFLQKLGNIIEVEDRIKSDSDMSQETLRDAKRIGLTDERIAELAGVTREVVTDQRHDQGILPAYKMVDTCAAEFAAKTPYYYSCYEDECEINPTSRKKVLILGAGPIRIGQGIEFDYCTVHAVMSLREEGIETHIVNNNPETVSTDFDTSDKLFFEPLTLEDVMNIIEREHPWGSVSSSADRRPSISQSRLQRRLRAALTSIPGFSGHRLMTWTLQRTANGLTSSSQASGSRSRKQAMRPQKKKHTPHPTESAIPCSCAPRMFLADGRWRLCTTLTTLIGTCGKL
jgi:carbamoyl-phosphate synthase large subunit